MKRLLYAAAVLFGVNVSYAGEGALDSLRASVSPSVLGGTTLSAVPRASAAENHRSPGESADLLAYNEVKRLFDKGVPATRADLTGWHAGRVFNNTGAVLGGLLVGKTAAEVPGGGPLFDAKTRFVVSLVSNWDPCFFDEMSSGAIAEMGEWAVKLTWDIKFPEVVGTPSASNLAQYPQMAGTNRTLEIRKAGDYIIRHSLDNAGGEAYAYYFKDVTPKP